MQELQAASLGFGVEVRPDTVMLRKEILATQVAPVKFMLNMRYEEVTIHFQLANPSPEQPAAGPRSRRRNDKFKFSIPFRHMHNIRSLTTDPRNLKLLLSLEIPPKFSRQLGSMPPELEKSRQWSERDSWFRQTDLVTDPAILKSMPLTLEKENVVIDLGRWTTYLITFSLSKADQALYHDMQRALQDYNIKTISNHQIIFTPSKDPEFWKFIKRRSEKSGTDDLLQSRSAIDSVLTFDVRYQLEVCISRGKLNEYNLTADFIRKLGHMDETEAKNLLEHIAVQKDGVIDPMSVFEADFVTSGANAKVPNYCCLVRSVVVTPTTLRLNAPSVETSNRILRQFASYSDRFLRVRFTDEAPGAKIFSTEKSNDNEIFTKIKRTMANGIIVGDRRYEFLAFGNSQFREHGAYFFAPLPDLSKWRIRAWMGSFDHIQYVALFASRLGQCFSTTRAIATKTRLDEISDIERNGFHFSDGVGKASPMLARIIAKSLGISQKGLEPPSVFQFRLGGCKGVLAVWPDLEGNLIHIRESQYKFPAAHEGLEVIRISQFASANLNRQLILVLASLGVPDLRFINKLRVQLSDLEEAMTNPQKALAILQRDIDHNQITLKLAEIVLDGFQERGEPFIMSLLALWRAWSVKYLKEKARITIPEGALLLGCLDETGILRGHYEADAQLEALSSSLKRPHQIPEIFVQLSNKPRGKSQVITGPMLLARNPSLHPGDIRVVCGVNVPELGHLKDCVVLPQTGDRDLASMCSGGDLDGDDFVIIWDQDLIPTEWNHTPMDYSPPQRVTHEGRITDNDLTNFFIDYMRNDKLPTIAHAHVALADASEDGVKSEKCKAHKSRVGRASANSIGLKLAQLHSKAVDFPKTGRPARLDPDLMPRKWPHFMEKKKAPSKIYRSKKVLGQLYDHVERVSFEPRFGAKFDSRILSAFNLSEDMLLDAVKLKADYDDHMHRIMAQHAIKTEYEVWSTFVMEHNHANDFKLHEEIGQISAALKDQFKEACIQKAGGRGYDHLAPFAAAMYTVTARAMDFAFKECEEGGQLLKADSMPLMTFPWLFPDILGKIARSKALGPSQIDEQADSKLSTHADHGETQAKVRTPEDSTLNSNVQDDIETTDGVKHRGDLLKLNFDEHRLEKQHLAERLDHNTTQDANKGFIKEEDVADDLGQSEDETEEVEIVTLRQGNAELFARLESLQ